MVLEFGDCIYFGFLKVVELNLVIKFYCLFIFYFIDFLKFLIFKGLKEFKKTFCFNDIF